MNNFNLNLLKYFYYVVYYNGFKKKKKNLNVVQSALSYNVKQLEIQTNKKTEDFGCIILDLHHRHRGWCCHGGLQEVEGT